VGLRVGHLAIGRSSEEASDRFFVGLLGLAKTRVRDLPAELSAAFFERRDPCRMIDYQGEGDVRFEVFVPEGALPAPRGYGHACLVVADRDELLERAAAVSEVLRAEREGREIVFLRDADGNLFEIQQES